jgi:beta-glucanase (GH16 family)
MRPSVLRRSRVVATFLVVSLVTVALSFAAPGGSHASQEAASPTAVQAAGDPAMLPGWGAPVWRDEFSGTQVDRTKWNVLDKTYVSYDAASIYARQATVSNGKLRLRAQRVDPRQDLYQRSWATAYLDTRSGKFAQRYGRFEISAKLPTTHGDSRGLWPSFWMRDNSGTGEIDIMEAWGTPSARPAEEKRENYQWTVHKDTNSSATGDDARVGGWGRPDGAPAITTGYHRYATEWTPAGLKFFFDDELVGQVKATQYPWLATSFPSQAHMRIQFAVGSAYWGWANSTTKSPADYLIDHVRVWAYQPGVSGLSGTVQNGGDVRLDWSYQPTPEATAIEVRRGTQVIATLPPAATGYTDPAVPAGTHQYQVTVLGEAGARSDPASTQVVVQDPVLVAEDASWRWRYSSAPLPTDWRSASFDDSTWSLGQAPLGFGWSGLRTNIGAGIDPAVRPLSAHFRKEFTLPNPGQFSQVTFDVAANDGVVLYLNGTEIGRRNLPTGPLTQNSYAINAPSQSAATRLTVTLPASALQPGENTLTGATHLNYRRTNDIVFNPTVRAQ